MPATPTANHEQEQQAGAIPSSTQKLTKPPAEPLANAEGNKSVRLHITPLTPALLKVYLAPSVLAQAANISYHAVETFPEKGFGYIELPVMEAQKLKKKLNGATLKGSKVRIEEAKPEKRKAAEDDDVADDKTAKRAKKEKKRKSPGVLDGVELPDDRKVKRGWTESSAKSKKDSKDQKGKKDKVEKKAKQINSKYTKEPELLFKAKLTGVAVTEVARKEKGKDKKKDKKSKSKNEAVVHEFERNRKQPSFLKSVEASTETKPAVEYVNGQGWVDEDGNVVEPETGKARNRRVLELAESTSPQPTIEKQKSATPESQPSPKSKSKPAKKMKKKQVTPPPSSSGSELEESSVVSSSSDDEDTPEPSSDEASEAATSPPLTCSSSQHTRRSLDTLITR